MTTPTGPGPNSLLPCGSESARRRHLARNETCPRCHVEGGRILPQDRPRLVGQPGVEAA
jgi:hypothetical protein